MFVSDEKINAIISVYNSNKATIQQLKESEDAGLDLEDSFELGYNNALEYVLGLIGIEV